MDSRPRLPSRVRRRREQVDGLKGPPDLQDLQQQLLNSAVFQKLLHQPDKIADVLRQDPALQHAAACNPDIAQLLDPSTVQQALELLVQPQRQPATDSSGSVLIQRKALMQLQNYAVQLQQARASGSDVLQQQDTSAQPQLQGGRIASQDAMWLQLQQRLNKYQQRTQALAAGQHGISTVQEQQVHQQQHYTTTWPSHQSNGTHAMQQQHHMLARQPDNTALQPHNAAEQPGNTQVSATTAAAHGESQPSEDSSMMQELLMAFPDLLSAAGTTDGSHATISLLSAVAEQPPAVASCDAGSSCSSSSNGTLQPKLQPSETCALPLTPQQSMGRPLQHHSGSDAAVAAAATSAAHGSRAATASCCTEAHNSSKPLLSGMRSASAQGHRILRPHSSSPIPVGSGSLPLGIEQLYSGELIVDITPPTKITKELSWSLDPDAGYVLDASASGSFSPMPLTSTAAVASAAASACASAASSAAVYGASLGRSSSGRASWGASLDSLVALAGGGGSSSIGHSSSTLGLSSLGPSSCDAPSTLGALPECGSCSSNSLSPASEAGITAASAVTAAESNTAVHAERTASWGSSGKLKAPVPRPKQPSNTANKGGAVAQTAVATMHAPQQYQEKQQHVLPVSTSSSSTAEPAQQHHNSGYQVHVSCNVHDATRTAMQPGAYGSGNTMLNPRSYYEDVAPSTWRPADAAEMQGNYLELYRRAYCSYADALFPPLWLGLICILVTARILPLWKVLLLGTVSFWGGLYVMAVKWAGVPTGSLSLSRVAPVMVVSLEVLCVGVFSWHVLPAMWLGSSLQCLLALIAAVAVLGLHLAAHLQDPGYTSIPDTEEGPCVRRLSMHGDADITAPANNSKASRSSSKCSGAVHNSDQSRSLTADVSTAGRDQHAAGTRGQQQQRQSQQPAPMLAGRSLNSCWTCGVERNLRSKHCPICKRCVERFDHHCPVIGNCVGAGNHRMFVGYLLALVLCQLLFCHLLGGLLVQQHATDLRLSHASNVDTVAAVAAAAMANQPSSSLVSGAGLAVGSSLAGVSQVDSGQTLDTASASGHAPSVSEASGPLSSESGETWVPGKIELGKPVVAVPAVNAAAAVDTAAAALAAAVANGDVLSINDATTTGNGAAAIPAAAAGRKLAEAAAGSDAATAMVAVTPDSHTSPASSTASSNSSGSASGSSRYEELDALMSHSVWSFQGMLLLIQALWAAAGTSPGLLLLLLLQVPAMFMSCSLLLRALALAAANLTVNEWLNRHRYLYLQHHTAGFCNRFDRGPAHNCWEFWFGAKVQDWWDAWQQGENDLQSQHTTVLTSPSASAVIRWWDVRWAKYQQKLLAARDRRKEAAMRRRMAALGLQWDGDASD